MKVLITGAAGFFGYHLTTYFEKKGADLTLLDIANFPKEEYTGKYKIINGDIRDKKVVDEAMKGQDFVIHTAAALPLWKKEDIFSTNIDGTQNLLSSALKHKVKRMVYISSTAVYGVPKKHPIEETDPRVGVGPYGISKIEAEKRCEKAMKEGLGVTIIRPKTFVGTGRLGVFEILFDWIHDGKKIPVVGSGNNLYELLDVDDLVEAVWLVVQKNTSNLNGAFNIGAEEYKTVKEDLTALFKAAGSGSKIFPTPAWPIKKSLYVFEKLGLSPLYQWVYETADKDSFVSIDKLKKALGWKPKYSNSEALIKAYKWYLKHYKEVKSKKSGVTHRVGWKQGILGLFKRFM